jgi:tetratricopeptide (TPR) repeat protein
MLYQLKKYPQALEAFNEALRYDETNNSAMFNKGLVLVELGQRDNALALFKIALERQPGTAIQFQTYGTTLMDAGKLDEAVSILMN